MNDWIDDDDNYLKNLRLIFFICLYFKGVDGDENLKIYLA